MNKPKNIVKIDWTIKQSFPKRDVYAKNSAYGDHFSPKGSVLIQGNTFFGRKLEERLSWEVVRGSLRSIREVERLECGLKMLESKRLSESQVFVTSRFMSGSVELSPWGK